MIYKIYLITYLKYIYKYRRLIISILYIYIYIVLHSFVLFHNKFKDLYNSVTSIFNFEKI